MTDINYKFEVGKEYKTRGGYVATIFDVNFNGRGADTIAGKIKKRVFEELILWESDGTFSVKENEQSPYDLLPPVETKEFWVNVYGIGSFGIWHDKGLADEHAADDRIGLLKITITGDQFEVEKVAI